MVSRSSVLFIFLGFMVTGWSSCTDDAKDGLPTLVGRWDIKEATRNGRATESLVDLYLVFTDEGKLETNISGTAAQGNYVYEEQLIKTTNLPLSMDYEVVTLTDSTLQLKSTFRNFRFDFSFRRTVVDTKGQS